MKELINASISGANLIPTSLFIFIIIYWLIVLIGIIDIDTLDVDVDVEVDLDIDADIDTDADTGADGGFGTGWFTTVLSFFNIGQMPLMVFLSFLSVPLWAISILANDYFGISNFFIGLIVFVPNLAISLFIAKFLSTPIAKIFIKLKKETGSIDPIGRMCTVLLTVKHDSIGQAEINVDGTTLRISAQTNPGIVLKKGQTALVIGASDRKNTFIIEPFENNK